MTVDSQIRSFVSDRLEASRPRGDLASHPTPEQIVEAELAADAAWQKRDEYIDRCNEGVADYDELHALTAEASDMQERLEELRAVYLSHTDIDQAYLLGKLRLVDAERAHLVAWDMWSRAVNRNKHGVVRNLDELKETKDRYAHYVAVLKRQEVE